MSYTRSFLVALLTVGAAHVAHAQATGLERTVDPAVAPGDDFFSYANGAWLKSATIPAGRQRFGAREEIAALTRAQVAAIYTAGATAPKGSLGRKIADYRAAYLDQASIEAKGVAPLRPYFASVDAILDQASLTRVLGRGMRADVDPLNYAVYQSAHILGLSVEPGINGETTYVPFLVQGGLGLSDRDDYLSTEPAKEALRTRYRAYVEHLFALAGFDHPDERAERVIGLEQKIAQTEATPEASARDHNADSLWSRADFARRAPGMDWTLFFTAAGLGHQESFVPWQPSAVTGVAALVASEPLPAWKDYLRFHALHDHIDLLPRAFAAEALTLQGAPAPGADADSLRVQGALAATQLALGEAIGRLYVERNFPPAEKARVLRIVANVKAAFLRRVEASTWMTPATKVAAIATVKALYTGIGYPERWQDYSDLTVDPRDAMGNAMRAEERSYRLAVAKLGHPVDRSEWWILPQTVGGILIFQQDAYDFTAALLQPPKYDRTASEAAAYGAIGAVIGHDISHYVDELGAEFDTLGRERRWWTPEDLSHFEGLAQPLIDQFSAYHPFPDVTVDGKKSMTENVADIAGLSAAFDAYRATLGSRAQDAAYVRQQDREFFIAFAQSYRIRVSDEMLRTQSASDHAPERYRVATVRNFEAWYDAFDVKPGQQLYLPPAARVRVW